MNRQPRQFGGSDHALVRFLERAGGLDLEDLRARLAGSLAHAYERARSITSYDFVIKADGLVYVVRGETVTTVIADHPHASVDALRHEHPKSE